MQAHADIMHQNAELKYTHLCLEVLLPELEVHLLTCRFLTRLLDIPGRNVRPAEVHTDIRLQRALQPVHVRAVQQAVAHAAQQAGKVRTTEVGPGLELGEGILVGADRIEDNVLRGVGVHFLRQVGVDAQELVAIRRAAGLGFQRREEGLEPFEG